MHLPFLIVSASAILADPVSGSGSSSAASSFPNGLRYHFFGRRSNETSFGASAAADVTEFRVTELIAHWFCQGLTDTESSWRSECVDGFCTRDDRTPSSVRCEAGDILQVANKYAAIRSELQTLSINGLISDVEYGLTGQVANSANYEQFLSNEKLGRMEVAGVHLASRFNHPARAFILLAKLYITIPGVYWPTMDVPTGPGDHSDWDICIQSSQERFVDDELRSIIERFTPGVSESTAPFFGHTADFKQIFSEFMVLASADRVSTLDPVQLDQYLAHLHYLGSHDFVLPLRTARWFYEAVTTSATARDLARHPTVPKPAVGGCWGLAHSDWIGPSKAVQMNRVDIDWERNVTTNDFDSMVAAYWNKPRSGYPVSARVIIVETLYEIKELIGLGGSSPGGIGASFLPEQWIPLADAYRRTLNVSSAVGADSGVGDKNRYVNAIYRVLAMLDTPEFNAASHLRPAARAPAAVRWPRW